MPGTVKLTTADARAWRANRAQWVSPDGYVIRALTDEEEKALFPIVENAKRVRRSGRATATAQYKVADPKSGQTIIKQEQFEVQIEIHQTGRDPQNFLLDVFVGGNRYVKGREILTKRILAKHGECILQAPNGKKICNIRDPRKNRPSFAESQRSAPAPEHCHCRTFKDNEYAGVRHHIACQWNEKAPPHERATTLDMRPETTLLDRPEPVLGLDFSPPTVKPVYGQTPPPVQQGSVWATPPPLPPGVTRGVTPTAPVVTSPEEEALSPADCKNDCRGVQAGGKGWAWPSGRAPEPNQHHPLCQFDGAWRRHLAGGRRMVLYDMDRHTEIRDATPDEVTKAELEAQRSGLNAVTIAGRTYAVVQSGTTPQVRERAKGMAGMRLPGPRVSPPQASLKPTPGVQVVGLPPRQPASSAPPPALHTATREELEAQLALLRAREASELPGVHEAAVDTGPVEVPAPSPPSDFSYGMAEPLRDERGLVGLQQKTDMIEPGPVDLGGGEPEFIDPLLAGEPEPEIDELDEEALGDLVVDDEAIASAGSGTVIVETEGFTSAEHVGI